jgi:fermentation-respiration switch protein FrsA (DUF1100 family)
VTLAGHLYRPPGLSESERTPAVALCGPFSSVKEQTLPHDAERLADAGYTSLTFDPRSLGESEGESRSHHDPNLVIEDYASAVSHLMTRDDVDPDRVAVVGVCMGGVVRGLDRRVQITSMRIPIASRSLASVWAVWYAVSTTAGK